MRCPSCFHELHEDSRSCPACGSLLPDSIAATMTGSSAKPSKPDSPPPASTGGSLPGGQRRSSRTLQTLGRFAPGTIIAERYRIVGMLGKGGMGNSPEAPYNTLRTQVDRLCAQLVQRYQSYLACCRGCSSCCRHHLSVFEVEAAMLRRAIARLPEVVRMRLRDRLRAAPEKGAGGEPESCPLLLDECCAVYDDRPIICRTQGLPLLIVAEDGALEVDFCPLNFTAPGAIAELEEDFLVPLEMLNQELVLANLAYCRAAGPGPPGRRTPLADLL